LALEYSDQSEKEHAKQSDHLEVLATFRGAFVKLVVSPRFEEEVPERSHDLHVSRSLVGLTGEGVGTIEHQGGHQGEDAGAESTNQHADEEPRSKDHGVDVSSAKLEDR